MDTVSAYREGLQWAQELLDMVTADLTPEQAHWTPPGVANPVAALYAHAVVAEDGVVHALLKGDTPLFASSWTGKTGTSDPQWRMTFDWGRSLQVDLPALREYAQAVHAAARDYVDSLTEADLERELDLSNVGLDRRPLSWALTALVIAHLNNMSGEISALKGVQGAQGYPF